MQQVPNDISQLTDAQLDALLNLDQPRGTRNNNPGNIEDGPFARSLPGYAGTDGRFAVFDSPEAGRNANDALMQRYGQQGLNTPLKIISRYAPPNENDTQAYAERVAQALGVRVNDPIDLTNPDVRARVFEAINGVENGAGAAPSDDITQMSDEELNMIAYGHAGTVDDPIIPEELSPEDRATLDQGMYVLINGEPRLMSGPAEVGTPGTDVAPGVRTREVNGVSDFAQSLGSGLIQGVTGLAELPGQIRNLGVSGITAASNFLNDGPDANAQMAQDVLQRIQPLPRTGQIESVLEGQFGALYEPQTTAGEYARTIGEFAPGAIVPGGVGTKLASALIPAVASETAGQVFEGKPEEGPARVLAALLSGGAIGVRQALQGGPASVIRSSTRGVTDQQLAEALQLRNSAQGMGVPLTQAEALQQVTGGATGLGRVQRVVEGTSSRLAPAMAERPAQVRQAVDNLTNQIGPRVDPAEATRLGQETAEGVLNRMRQRVNESATPDYRAVDGQVVSAEEYAALQELPTYRLAEESLFSNAETRPRGAPQSLDAVDRVVRRMAELESSATPTTFNPDASMTLAASRGSQTGLARDVSAMASPELARARLTGASGREAFVDPLKTGPLGVMANQAELRPTLPNQTAALFPAVPAEGQADQTLQALSLMNEINPAAGPALTRQFLATQANEILQKTRAGSNQFGGADLAAKLMGNPEQERALLGAIDQAEPFNDARRLAEVLRATGTREPVGSQTSFNNQLQNEIAGGNAAQEGMRALMNPTAIPGRIASVVDNAMTRMNADKLAEFLLADPETARRAILQAQLNRSGSNRTRAAVALTQGED